MTPLLLRVLHRSKRSGRAQWQQQPKPNISHMVTLVSIAGQGGPLPAACDSRQGGEHPHSTGSNPGAQSRKLMAAVAASTQPHYTRASGGVRSAGTQHVGSSCGAAACALARRTPQAMAPSWWCSQRCGTAPTAMTASPHTLVRGEGRETRLVGGSNCCALLGRQARRR